MSLYKTFGKKTICGVKYLMAQEKKDGPIGFYDTACTLTNILGGPHYSIRKLVRLEGELHAIARHVPTLGEAVYQPDGNILPGYGGMHNFVYGFSKIKGVMCLSASEYEDFPPSYYSPSGNILQSPNPKENMYPLSPHFPSNLMGDLHTTKELMFSVIDYKKGRQVISLGAKSKIRSHLTSSLNKSIDAILRRDSPSEIKHEELKKMFRTLHRVITHNPFELMQLEVILA